MGLPSVGLFLGTHSYQPLFGPILWSCPGLEAESSSPQLVFLAQSIDKIPFHHHFWSRQQWRSHHFEQSHGFHHLALLFSTLGIFLRLSSWDGRKQPSSRSFTSSQVLMGCLLYPPIGTRQVLPFKTNGNSFHLFPIWKAMHVEVSLSPETSTH